MGGGRSKLGRVEVDQVAKIGFFHFDLTKITTKG